MSTTQPSSLNPRLPVALPEGAGAEGARATSRTRAPSASPERTAATGQAVLPWLGGAAASPSGWLVSALASRGAGTDTGTGYAKGTGEWAFLSDPSLSVEDKLARFMMTVQKKLDDELTSKMNDYRAKYGDEASGSKGATSESKKEDGGFLGGLLGAIFPVGGIFGSLFGGLDKMLGDALKNFGGPLLAALASAVGLPMLAPAAAKVGKELGTAVADALGGGKASGSSAGTKSTSGTKASSTTKTSSTKTSSTTTKGEAGSPDERLEMLEIQRMVEKQNQLFTLVSNLMKSMHETTMVAVQNVR
jgi:hypothetical protein